MYAGHKNTRRRRAGLEGKLLIGSGLITLGRLKPLLPSQAPSPDESWAAGPGDQQRWGWGRGLYPGRIRAKLSQGERHLFPMGNSEPHPHGQDPGLRVPWIPLRRGEFSQLASRACRLHFIRFAGNTNPRRRPSGCFLSAGLQARPGLLSWEQPIGRLLAVESGRRGSNST